MMPGLFSVGQQEVLEEIRHRLHPDDVVVAFLDDVFIITSPDRARAAYDIAAEVMPRRIGVQLQTRMKSTKTREWCRRPFPAPPGIAELGEDVWRSDRPPAERGLRVVGTPVGSDEYIAAFLQRRLQTQRDLIDMLPYV